MAIDITSRITGTEKDKLDRAVALQFGEQVNEGIQAEIDRLNEEHTEAVAANDAENAARAARNAEAGLNPGDVGYEEPLPAIPDPVLPTLMPLTTNIEIYNAYEVYQSALLQSAHADYRIKFAHLAVNKKEIRDLIGGIDPEKLDELKTWLEGNQLA